MPGFLRSRRGAVVVTIVLLLVWLFLRQQVVRMDARFFHLSVSGTKGLLLYLAGDYRGAARAYRAHLRRAIENGDSLGETAFDALVAGNLDAAERRAKEALEDDATAIHALLTLGEIALERRDYARAREIFGRVLQRHPDQFDALLLQSVVQTRAQNHGAAVATFNRAFRTNTSETRPTAFLSALETAGELARRPAGEQPLCLLAHYYRYFRIFDPSNARPASRYARKAIAAGDRPADAYLTLGVLYAKEGRRERALEAFLKAVEVDPRHAEAYRWAAQMYADRGDLPNEYRMARGAFLAAPDDSFYLRVYHWVLTEKLGDYRQALAVAQAALATTPDVEVHWRLGYLYGFLGDDGRSVEHYRQAVRLDPRNPVLAEGIGNGLRNLGRAEEAIAAYRQALAISPQRGRTHVLLAGLYHDRGRYQEAVREYERAFALGERDATALENLCALYHVTSHFARAQDCFQAVLATDPKNPRALRLLPEIRENLRLQGAAR